MARNFIKRSDLPSDFDIKRYDVCATWDLGLWASNLHRRILLRNQVTHSLKYYEGLKVDDLELEITEDYLNEPEVEWSIKDENDLGVDLSDGYPVYANRVRDVNALDLFDLAEGLKDPEKQRYADLYRAASQERGESIVWEENEAALDAYSILLTTPEWKIFEPLSANSGSDLLSFPFALAEIDLSASDEELIVDFRSWLTTARRNRGFETDAEVFGPAELRKWVDFRVLAYIDLKTWLLARGLNATDQLLGETLFPDPDPDGKNKGEQVRRTVYGYAKRLTSSSNIRAMQSQYLKAAKNLP